MSSETLGNISTLECLDLDFCDKIEVLPQQVAQQMSLERLCLKGTNLKELPSAIGALSFLEHLSVGSPFLDTLPPSLCDLKNLKTLRVDNCMRLKCLPASLELLTQLTDLSVSSCPLISELPFKKAVEGDRETLSDLNSSIHSCILPRLQELRVDRTGISEVSFAQGVCFNLRDLHISCCDNVVEVGTLPNTLLNLWIYECRNLRKIGNMDGLAELQWLTVVGCSKLEELPGIETLVSLTSLVASRCVKLKSIRGLRQLTKLQGVQIEGCSDLEEVEGIQHCMSLEWLDAGGCPKLRWSAGVVEQLRQRSALRLIGV
jgi:Leucine-rich repeat (LRR) protein